MSVVDADAICVENIPQELRDQRSWVTWRLEREGERSVKPPYDPRTGHKAKSNDPSTWGSFGEACQAVAEGHYDGIGFELAPPIVGIDLDGCRDPESGFIDDGAQTIIDELDSYTEVSPSGRGIHILAKGQLPPGGRRMKGVEIYDRDRYFTVTGQHIAGTPLAVEERSAELAALHLQRFGSQEPISAMPYTIQAEGSSSTHASVSLSNEILVAKMRDAGNGELFKRLWCGDWSGGEYDSQSEADAALCCILAFWTGRDAERMDQLFRESGLYRPKWDELRGSQTYGEKTIAKAISGTHGIWNPSRRS